MNPLQRLLAAVGVVCLPVLATACDICGCAAGGNSLGLLSLVSRHFVGFRGQSQAFSTDAHGSEPNSVEGFRSLELWGRWQPHRRWQIIGSMPFQFNSRHSDDGKSLKINSLGDASLLAQFALLDPARQSVRRWQHTVQVGGGAKLPTGKTSFKDPNSEIGELPPALQPGTGSTDFLASGLYALRLGKLGASVDASYRFMGKNADGYRFGNRLNTGFRVFSTQKLSKTSFLPYIGAFFDRRNADFLGDEKQADTGGWATFGMLGAEVFRGDLGISLGCQLPLASEFANGRVAPKPRLNASAVLLFGGKKSGMVVMNVPAVFPAVQNPVSPIKN